MTTTSLIDNHGGGSYGSQTPHTQLTIIPSLAFMQTQPVDTLVVEVVQLETCHFGPGFAEQLATSMNTQLHA